jgi:hypothetical protein
VGGVSKGEVGEGEGGVYMKRALLSMISASLTEPFSFWRRM